MGGGEICPFQGGWGEQEGPKRNSLAHQKHMHFAGAPQRLRRKRVGRPELPPATESGSPTPSCREEKKRLSSRPRPLPGLRLSRTHRSPEPAARTATGRPARPRPRLPRALPSRPVQPLQPPPSRDALPGRAGLRLAPPPGRSVAPPRRASHSRPTPPRRAVIGCLASPGRAIGPGRPSIWHRPRLRLPGPPRCLLPRLKASPGSPSPRSRLPAWPVPPTGSPTPGIFAGPARAPAALCFLLSLESPSFSPRGKAGPPCPPKNAKAKIKTEGTARVQSLCTHLTFPGSGPPRVCPLSG